METKTDKVLCCELKKQVAIGLTANCAIDGSNYCSLGISDTRNILHAAALIKHRGERIGTRAQKRGRERRRLQQRLHAQQHALARVAIDRALAARVLAQLAASAMSDVGCTEN